MTQGTPADQEPRYHVRPGEEPTRYIVHDRFIGLDSRCPAGLVARLERVKRHAETEQRAATDAVAARRAKEIAEIHAREAARAPGAETRVLYEAAYHRQKQGQAESRAAFGLPSEAAVRQEAETAARAATEAVWLAYITAQEGRFGL